MKKAILKLQKKVNILGVLNALAFALMVGSVNATCLWIHHQPKVPDEAKKYRKF